jgi:hypothetical protein
MWRVSKRATRSSPGNSPPKRKKDTYVPTIGIGIGIGIGRIVPFTTCGPVPDSRSSGRS